MLDRTWKIDLARLVPDNQKKPVLSSKKLCLTTPHNERDYFVLLAPRCSCEQISKSRSNLLTDGGSHSGLSYFFGLRRRTRFRATATSTTTAGRLLFFLYRNNYIECGDLLEMDINAFVPVSVEVILNLMKSLYCIFCFCLDGHGKRFHAISYFPILFCQESMG